MSASVRDLRRVSESVCGVSQSRVASPRVGRPTLGTVSEDEGRESLRALAAHLAGPAEIASSLGVEANTINVWKTRHPDFPAPVRRLKSGDLWDIREVQLWAERTGRSFRK